MDAAELLFAHGDYRIANNRAYYSIFRSMRSVLTFDSFDTKKHSGVIAEFRKRYIKEGIFPVELSAMIGSAFTIRNASDYDDMFIASKSDTEQQIKNAKRIYEEVEVYVKKMLDDSNQKERKEAFAQLEQLRKTGTVSDDEVESNAYKEEKYTL